VVGGRSHHCATPAPLDLFNRIFLFPAAEMVSLKSVLKKNPLKLFVFQCYWCSDFFFLEVPEITIIDGKFIMCCLICGWDLGFNLIIWGIFQF